MTRLVVTGSRGLCDDNAYEKLSEMVEVIEKTFGPIDEIVHGACKNSPDVLAHIYGNENGIPIKTYPAKWQRGDGSIDRGAGFKRNTVMAEYADVGIALWDGQSNGTKHMINELARLDKPFYVAYILKGNA
jgi:hypothetical protein